MIRKRSIVTLISILLLGAMTLGNTAFVYLEQEELIEVREVEIQESEEGKDWTKWLFSGGTDNYISDVPQHTSQFAIHYILGFAQRNTAFQKSPKALFLIYCCLKIPLH